jgi:phosphatidylinositol-3-phosphatase
MKMSNYFPRWLFVLIGLVILVVVSAVVLYSINVMDKVPKNTTPSSSLSTKTMSDKHVFLIVMENHNWSDIKNNPSAPYINHTLLPIASYAEQYYNPPGNHPSEPNYLWLEAGTNFGISNDADPTANHQSTSKHLVTLLSNAGISWKSYQEGISGTECPLIGSGLYAPKHNPMVFFDDVTNTNDPNSSNCISHIRPSTELATDLQHSTEANYNFITPHLCDDMHDTCAPINDPVKQGDSWLAQNLPTILNSQAYKNGGVVFITWDEGEGGDGPIGMIVLSNNAKGGGYSNTIHYTHSSTLRTLEEIFGVTPLLGDAANATDLGDLFKTFP